MSCARRLFVLFLLLMLGAAKRKAFDFPFFFLAFFQALIINLGPKYDLI